MCGERGGGQRGRGMCARARGEGGRCAQPPSVTMWPSVAGARPGLAKVGRGARGAAGDGGAADGDGARTPLGGDESRRAPSTGANPGGGGGSATPSLRGRTGPGRAPPEGHRGGGLGWAPGLRGPGPGSAWAGAWETGRALGLRPGGGGAGGLCWLGAESREAPGGWARAPEGGRSLRGGGGGCSLPGGRRGPLLSEGGGRACIARCRFMAARHGTLSPTLRAESLFGGAEGGGGGLAVVACTHPCGGGGRRWELRPAWPKKPGGVPWAHGPL